MKEKKASRLPLPIIITLVSMVLITVLLFFLFYWQNNKPPEAETKTEIFGGELDKNALAANLEPIEIEDDDPDGNKGAGELASSDEKDYLARELFSYSVPETKEEVDNSYFNDVLFIGDSITTGIPHYMEKEFPDIKVVAERGVHLFNILVDKKIRTDSKEYKTVLDAVKEHDNINKFYIMLGGNDLGYEEPVFIKGYNELVDELQSQYPDAIIYLQSIPPVTGTQDQLKNYPNSNNEDIERCNILIMEIAKEKGVHYLDVASVLMDSTGKLPEDASSDGVHFVSEYYYKWFDYLKKHTVIK